MKTSKKGLNSLPNIGKVLAEKLKVAGIETPADLKALGSEKAFIRLRSIDNTACLSMLFAIEGAVQEIRWHSLDNSRKNELKSFFNSLI